MVQLLATEKCAEAVGDDGDDDGDDVNDVNFSSHVLRNSSGQKFGADVVLLQLTAM